MATKKAATAAVAPATQPVAPAVSIAQFTPEQLAVLQKQLRDKAKADRGDLDGWQKIVDAMLQEREGEGFKNTTSDILAAVVAKGVIPSQLTDDQRAMQLKRIQTRKQHLSKLRDTKGNLIWEGKLGYKVSANSFGPMTADKIVAWFAVPANLESLSVTQAEAIAAALADMV